MRARVKTVITYGTFDMFHVGHLRLLKRMRDLGERVIVAVSTDEFNVLKGKRALVPYEERREIIEALRCVDLVIPECTWEQKAEDIRKYDVGLFVMGSDWVGNFDYLNELCEVVYLERTHGVSSTELRESLGRLLGNELEIKNIFELLKSLRSGME
ncbi:adenylyltransferase/cytidyltransferase family protein [Stutzerimonas nitrititolerans]|uniref:adenylyltransferase/cytidyltransferase family protein n=1 Tax=Stutzerimonas nitrititolerans TaxID=2482751 RepID=UPI002899C80C|nr:adenylyltransferase/cytidyltransferase family protein [Stutzerimonas nitrititolerans]